MKNFFVKSISMLMLLASTGAIFGQKQKATAIVNADQGTVQISRCIYGQFSEHLGRCVYEGFG